MRRMGETPSRCHNVDRTGLVQTRRISNRVSAYCDCPDKTWALTPKRATKIDRLYCRKCKGSLNLEKAA